MYVYNVYLVLLRFSVVFPGSFGRVDLELLAGSGLWPMRIDGADRKSISRGTCKNSV